MLPKSYQTFEFNVSEEERVPLFTEYYPNNRRPSTAPQVSSTSTNLSPGSLIQTSPSLPLSWPEARHRLRIVLQQFLDTPSSSRVSKPLPLVGVEETENVHNSFRGGVEFFLYTLWKGYFDPNWDTVTTLVSSLFFLFFSISLLFRQDRPQHETQYISFCFSTFLFFMIVVFTGWIHWKRKFSKYMEEPHIRHIVSHYLKKLHWEEQDPNKSSSQDTSWKDDDIMDEDIPATHLNDIYNVFRLSSPPTTFSSTTTNPTQLQPCGKWLRVPSLLLVKGYEVFFILI